MREKLYKLYKECFKEINIEAQENYIATRYNGENEFVFNEGDDITAMVLGNKFSLSVGGNVISVANISGLCVDEDYRKTGLASKLIIKAMNKLAEENVVAVTAFPHHKEFFDKLQFESLWFSEKIAISNIIEASSPLTQKNAGEMLALYNDFIGKMYIAKIRTIEDFQLMIEENSIGGMIVGCYNGTRLMAYAIVDSNGKIVETCHLDKFYLNKLGVDYVSLPTGIGKPENSIRIINAIEFLKQIKYVPAFVISMKMKITDSTLSHNNVIVDFAVKGGVATVVKLSADSEYDIEYTIEDLTSTVVRSGVNVMFEKD